MPNTDNVSDLLGKLVIKESVKVEPRKRTLEEYRISWEARTRAFQRLVESKKKISEGYLPSDEVDREKDVAFGVTRKSKEFLSADMIKDEYGNPPRSMGTISHLGLLIAAGYGKEGSEQTTDEFAVRGVVKAKLGGRVIFWEDTPTLTASRYAPYVKASIENLLNRKLITLDTEIYGAGENVAVATAEEIKRDW